jgi:hypothetical protein
MTNDEFEDMAREFYEETGYLAPGKDWPAARGGDPRGEYDVRLEKWTQWKAKRSQPSKLACEIERQFAESKLVGPARRLGGIVDECLKELRATIKCCGCNGWFPYSELQPSSGHPEADPICNRCLDEYGLRKQRDALLEALGNISSPHDCGCKPCTGQCRSQEALAITLDEIRCIATEAIIAATTEPSPLEAIAANNSDDPVLSNFEQGVRDGLVAASANAQEHVDV